jgi:hypothetical protein
MIITDLMLLCEYYFIIWIYIITFEIGCQCYNQSFIFNICFESEFYLLNDMLNM